MARGRSLQVKLFTKRLLRLTLVEKTRHSRLTFTPATHTMCTAMHLNVPPCSFRPLLSSKVHFPVRSCLFRADPHSRINTTPLLDSRTKKRTTLQTS